FHSPQWGRASMARSTDTLARTAAARAQPQWGRASMARSTGQLRLDLGEEALAAMGPGLDGPEHLHLKYAQLDAQMRPQWGRASMARSTRSSSSSPSTMLW